MSPYVLAFLIGVIAGLRSLTAPAVVSWAARVGWLNLGNTWLAFLGYAATPYILSVLALAELVADKLPKTPSRKAPPGFGARLVTGAVCGAPPSARLVGLRWAGWSRASSAASRAPWADMSSGPGWSTRSAENDLPIALLEDAIAIGGAFLIVTR